jgi:hypothetical protein
VGGGPAGPKGQAVRPLLVTSGRRSPGIDELSRNL